MAVGALEYYSDFFGVTYPLPKVDLIALEDFAIGAMENWGLLTFRERFLLNNDATSSGLNKEWVALIVAHEVAHQVCTGEGTPPLPKPVSVSYDSLFLRLALSLSLSSGSEIW